MARLVRKGKNLLLSGKVGTIQFRTVRGKTFIISAPERHKKSKSKKAIAGRSNFASVVGFSKRINSISVIKDILNNSSLPGIDSYHKLMKGNMLKAEAGFLTTKNFITPPGQRLVVSDYFIEDHSIHTTFDMFGIIRAPLTLYQIFYLYNNRKTNDIFFFNLTTFIDIEQSNNIRKKGESKYSIKIELVENVREMFSRYRDAIVYMAVKGTPMNKYKRFWTSTIAKEITID